MESYYLQFTKWLGQCSGSVWAWFNGLERQEWLVLLGTVAVLGFFCMRGYGSRSHY